MTYFWESAHIKMHTSRSVVYRVGKKLILSPFNCLGWLIVTPIDFLMCSVPDSLTLFPDFLTCLVSRKIISSHLNGGGKTFGTPCICTSYHVMKTLILEALLSKTWPWWGSGCRWTCQTWCKPTKSIILSNFVYAWRSYRASSCPRHEAN